MHELCTQNILYSPSGNLYTAIKYYLLPRLYRLYSANYIMYFDPGREDFWPCACTSVVAMVTCTFHAGTLVAALHSKLWRLKDVLSLITE